MRQEEKISTQENVDDQPNFGFNFLSFMVPLAGGIIYFANKARYPKMAQAAGRAALLGLGFSFLLNLILFFSKQSQY